MLEMHNIPGTSCVDKQSSFICKKKESIISDQRSGNNYTAAFASCFPLGFFKNRYENMKNSWSNIYRQCHLFTSAYLN